MDRYLWLALPLILLGDSAARADVNAGGVLIVHANPTTVYTPGEIDWCPLSTLETCAKAITSLGSARGDLTPRIWFFITGIRIPVTCPDDVVTEFD